LRSSVESEDTLALSFKKIETRSTGEFFFLHDDNKPLLGHYDQIISKVVKGDRTKLPDAKYSHYRNEIPEYFDALKLSDIDDIFSKNRISGKLSIPESCKDSQFEIVTGVNMASTDGGGQQALDYESIKKLSQVMYNYFKSKEVGKILWIGCGFGEEVVILIRILVYLGIDLTIKAIDHEQACVDHANELAKTYSVSDRLKVSTENLYYLSVEDLTDEFDIVYTGAAVNEMFYVKVFYIACWCKSDLLTTHKDLVTDLRKGDWLPQTIKAKHNYANVVLEKIFSLSLYSGSILDENGTHDKEGDSTVEREVLDERSLCLINYAEVIKYLFETSSLTVDNVLNDIRTYGLGLHGQYLNRAFGSLEKDNKFSCRDDASKNQLITLAKDSKPKGNSIVLKSIFSNEPFTQTYKSIKESKRGLVSTSQQEKRFPKFYSNVKVHFAKEYMKSPIFPIYHKTDIDLIIGSVEEGTKLPTLTKRTYPFKSVSSTSNKRQRDEDLIVSESENENELMGDEDENIDDDDEASDEKDDEDVNFEHEESEHNQEEHAV
jgi:SAM-dependent methyltransferase